MSGKTRGVGPGTTRPVVQPKTKTATRGDATKGVTKTSAMSEAPLPPASKAHKPQTHVEHGVETPGVSHAKRSHASSTAGQAPPVLNANLPERMGPLGEKLRTAIETFYQQAQVDYARDKKQLVEVAALLERPETTEFMRDAIILALPGLLASQSVALRRSQIIEHFIVAWRTLRSQEVGEIEKLPKGNLDAMVEELCTLLAEGLRLVGSDKALSLAAVQAASIDESKRQELITLFADSKRMALIRSLAPVDVTATGEIAFLDITLWRWFEARAKVRRLRATIRKQAKQEGVEGIRRVTALLRSY